MPITRDQAVPLAQLLCVIRPNWNIRGVLARGLAPLEHHPASLADIAYAAIRAAHDPEHLTPAVIPLDGPHWNRADKPPQPRLTPDHECRRHPGQWASSCRGCAVDPLGPDVDTTPLETDPRAAARAAIARPTRHVRDQAANPLLCNAEHPDVDTICRRPPGHRGDHADYTPDAHTWPQEQPVATDSEGATP